VLALLTSATLSGPSWRYQLPQLALLPPAAALAVDGWRRTGARPPTRRALAPPHAVTLAAAVGAVVGLAAVASGWATPSTAVEAGAAAFALAALLCLRARRRLPEGG
jgi:heme A synthase